MNPPKILKQFYKIKNESHNLKVQSLPSSASFMSSVSYLTFVISNEGTSTGLWFFFFRVASVRLNWICRWDVAGVSVWTLEIDFRPRLYRSPGLSWLAFHSTKGSPGVGGGWWNMRPFQGLSAVKHPPERKPRDHLTHNEQAFNGYPPSGRGEWEVR